MELPELLLRWRLPPSVGLHFRRMRGFEWLRQQKSYGEVFPVFLASLHGLLRAPEMRSHLLKPEMQKAGPQARCSAVDGSCEWRNDEPPLFVLWSVRAS